MAETSQHFAAVLVRIVNTLGHYSGSICMGTGGHRCEGQIKRGMFRIERERVVVAVGSPIAGVGQNERIVGDEKSSLVPKMERRLRPR